MLRRRVTTEEDIDITQAATVSFMGCGKYRKSSIRAVQGSATPVGVGRFPAAGDQVADAAGRDGERRALGEALREALGWAVGLALGDGAGEALGEAAGAAFGS